MGGTVLGREVAHILFGGRWLLVKLYLMALFAVAVCAAYSSAWSGATPLVATLLTFGWCFLWTCAWFVVRCIYLVLFRW